MEEMKNNTIEYFIEVLSSKAPTPGGGGASALVGAIGAALGCMVSNLTIGKAAYVDVEDEMKDALNKLSALGERMLGLIDEDAASFTPLAQAYRLPSNTEEEKAYKKEQMDIASMQANIPPLTIVDTAIEIIDALDVLAEKGSKLALSDVGCAAICAKAAIEGAILNVYINKGEIPTDKIAEAVRKADAIYAKVVDKIK